ncbi:hypothetical protein F4823DRAFT_286040 [Ustulina deusta]|nr:hypothetical protein F4823DRAFT_286040 [Ustulina deusta]
MRTLADVFLVNCIGSSDAQSEAAYYSSAPIADPDTIAVVTTPSEGLKTWEDTTTTATFTNAGSTTQTGFTVTLGRRPNDGEMAGVASNTYDTSFACYAQASTFLYTHEDRNCFGVYDCSHADRVSETVSETSLMATPTSLGSKRSESTWFSSSWFESSGFESSWFSSTWGEQPITTPTSPTRTPPTTTTTTTKPTKTRSSAAMETTTQATTRRDQIPTQASESSTPSRTSQAALTSSSSSTDPPGSAPTPRPQVGTAVGIAVGVTLGTILLAVTSISLLRKYWSRRCRRRAGEAAPRKSDGASSSSDGERKSSRLDSQSITIYEAGGTARPAELAGCWVHVHELEARPSRGG